MTGSSDGRAGEYVEELKRRCGSSRWNLVEVDFIRRQREDAQDSD
ncbi:MAG: hypothetical protein U5P41_15395 [Gammaproteobacteria bacterium]|nr:hypothetical protein [Gammaproteobacteria bacterium]